MSALSQLARKQWMSVKLWQFTTVASLVAIPVTNYHTLKAAMQNIRIGAMDSRGSWYFFNTGTFEDEKDLHIDMAVTCAETIFNRHPSGLDFPDRVPRLFNSSKNKEGVSCEDKVNKLFAENAESYRSMLIHSKFELSGTKEVKWSDSRASVQVDGQQVLQWTFNGRPMDNSKPVRIYVDLVANNDVAHNGKYPMVVSAFDIQYLSQQQTAAR